MRRLGRVGESDREAFDLSVGGPRLDGLAMLQLPTDGWGKVLAERTGSVL